MEKLVPNDRLKEIAYKVWCTNDIKSVLKPNPAKTAEYNDVPVYWCNTCKSLLVINASSPLLEDLECYCSKCNSTSITKGHINEWENITNK